MKDTYVKELRRLLEGEVDQAEVIIAGKGLSQELQDMIEKIGRMMNEDLGPLTDQMRDTYSPEMSNSFYNTVYGELETVLGSLRSAKDSVDSSVGRLSGTEGPADMTDELPSDPLDDQGDELELDLDDADDEISSDELGLSDELDDEFGGAEAGMDEPLGRAAKESTEHLANKIVEMRAKLARARKLKEAQALANK